ncbi:MAG: 50S ribosomal protein L30 [Anaerolineae bacterium]|jgi:large subunit ribosomal protein L30|nr:50S ribosomal protein L30 [Anaerolineae bacterium]
MAKALKITLVRSVIGYGQGQRVTVKTLGLGKLQTSVVHKDTPQIRGMIEQVKHLVRVEEVEQEG